MYERKIVKHFIDADALIKRGFVCRGINRDRYDHSKLIFWFDNTPEVNKALLEISNNIKNNNQSL